MITKIRFSNRALPTSTNVLLGSLLSLASISGVAQAVQIDLPAPAGSGRFGSMVRMLPNGNFLVGDSLFDAPGPIVDVGAVYLYRADGVLVSALYGSSADDRIGSQTIELLSNGNFVVRSPNWDNGTLVDAGAVTWGNSVTGVSGQVSATNSLVGGVAGEAVGGPIGSEFVNLSVIPLSNGHYVVRTPGWDNAAALNAGAVTWGNGDTGVSGVISSGNSLVGATTNDRIGSGRVTALTNGHYVVGSPAWDHGAVADVGAVTWANGSLGAVASVSSSNSLIGSTPGDAVGGYGYGAVTALSNGNYVVVSPFWQNGNVAEAGAATWGNGATGIVGVVSPTNSLVGSHIDDSVGSSGIYALSNGNYVVSSESWDSNVAQNLGAVTWGNGSFGVSGAISTSNSLVGVSAYDTVGYNGVTPLTNGHYAVNSTFWDNGPVRDVGAITWGNGETGSSGMVNATNSLIGSSPDDKLGYCGVRALSTGHYVVCSSLWNHGALVDVGAVTWRNGGGSSSGVVAASNSLIGSKIDDEVGFGLYGGVVALSNGKYVVSSRDWDNGSISNAGAVTLCDDTGATVGEINAGNSLVGATANDQLGNHGLVTKSNGDYVVISAHWDNASVVNAGAVTWGDGDTGVVGAITSNNSLVGGSPNDFMVVIGASAYNDGRTMYSGYGWDNGAVVNAGAITLAAADGTTTGLVTSQDSVLGTVAGGGGSLRSDYDELRVQMVVGQPLGYVVTLFRPGQATSTSIANVSPSPSEVGALVTISVAVVASDAPTSGTVRIVASSGEECLTNVIVPVDETTAEFSCQLMFLSTTARTLRAEFFGTQTHGYSASVEVPHFVNPDPNAIFGNGYE